jgi:hypothetical protein
MNPCFETINGTLCIMMDKPEPLTKDAKFPCLVRLIQDDSPMGRMNKRAYPIDRISPFIAVDLEQSGEISAIGNVNTHLEHESHEIIGYPVEEGSAEWAWHHLTELGNKVWHPAEQSMETTALTLDRFVSCHAKTGWKLYEPEPKPLPSPGSQEWALEAMKKGYKITGTSTDCIVYWEMVHDTIYMRYKLGKNDPNVIGFPTYSWGSNLEENDFMIYDPKPKPCLICNGTGFVSYDDMDRITTQSCSCHHISEQSKPESATQADLSIASATQPQFMVGDCKIELVKQVLKNLLDKI